MCPGCYKPNFESYCPDCRKQLFDSRKVSHILPFDPPRNSNLASFQEQTKRLSISGVQLKYSLRLEHNELVLTDRDGQYILKPVPPSVQLQDAGQAPENEHLTMQIAAQVYGIDTASNALIYFRDGTPAYLTRRFDARPDGSRFLQEDMAQLSGRSRQTGGEHFKYNGTYEEAGLLIRKYVAAYVPALERYFRLVVFNYLFSNGDAHLKNFSLIHTTMGDYTLSKAYDLMSTILHVPDEPDTALDLYEDDTHTAFYSACGCYGQENFRILAEKMGLPPVRTERILTQLLSSRDRVLSMIHQSLLDERIKQKYASAYLEKLKRMGMTRTLIAAAVSPDASRPKAIATNIPVTLTFLRGAQATGMFQAVPPSAKPAAQNKYLFLASDQVEQFQKTGNEQLVTTVDGDFLVNVAPL